MGDPKEQVKKEKEQNVPAMTQQEKYEQQQQNAWKLADEYMSEQKSGLVATKQGIKHISLNDKNLFQLRDELFLDTYSKSESFERMYNAVNDLLNLSISGGRFFDEEGNGATADFFANYFEARQAVDHYLDTHEGFQFMSNSRRRYQIAQRVKKILSGLGTKITEMKKKLSKENALRIEGAMQGLDAEEIEVKIKEEEKEEAAKELHKVIETGQFGPEMDEKKAKEVRDKWLASGFSEDLKKMIEGKTFKNKEDKNIFLAYLQDVNGRLLANKMSVTLLLENEKNKLLGINDITLDLEDFINERCEKEYKDLMPDQFAVKVKELIKEFYSDNKAMFDRMSKRKKALEKDPVIGSSMYGDNLYNISGMKNILLTEDEEEYKKLVGELKERVKQHDKKLDELVSGHFTELNREEVRKKLDKNLGALRLFGTEEQISDQANLFCDMFRFIEPEAYKEERDFKRAMKSLKIEEVRSRDFINYVKQQKSEANEEKDFSWWKKKGEEYAKRVKKNTKSYLKRVTTDGLALTLEQWEELEELNLQSGSWENRAFKIAVETVLEEDTSKKQKRYSRREFLTRREFNDSENMPLRKKLAKQEKLKIKKIGDSLDKKLLVLLSGDGSDPNEDYIKLDDAYKGNEALRKAFLASNADNIEVRTSNVGHVLQKAGLLKKDRTKYLKKFEYIIRYMRDVNDDMHEDERLLNERCNLETFGVKSWNELMERLEAYGPNVMQIFDGEQSAAAKKQYDKSFKKLEEFDGGRYKAIAGLLTNIPEIYAAMLSENEKELSDLLDKKVKPGFKDLIGSYEKIGVFPEAMFKQYVFSFARDLYDGSLKGNEAFFTGRLKDYKKKVYDIKPDGLSSITSNLKAARDEIDRIVRGQYEKAFALGLRDSVMFNVERKVNTTEEFHILMDKEKLINYAKKELSAIRKDMKDNAKDAAKKEEKILKGIKHKFDDSLPPADPEEEIRKNIHAKKEKGRAERLKYLGYDHKTIDGVRLGGSLIRVGSNGRELVTLSKSTVNKMRGKLEKYAGSVELPQVLKDALIEEGASADAGEKLKGTFDDGDKLYNHAAKMEALYKFLREDTENDAAMSDEEAQMFIVNIYGDPKMRSLFDAKKNPDVTKLRKSNPYKIFRDNYAKLKKFESVKQTENALKRQQLEISRNMRTMLITNVGYLDKKGKSVEYHKLSASKKLDHMKSLGDLIDKQTEYMEQESKLTDHVRLHVMAFYDGMKMSDIFLERQVEALREYFMEDLTKSIKEGKKFDPKVWDKAITDFYKVEANRRNLEFSKNHIDEKMLEESGQRRMDSTAGEKNIADTIKASVVAFHGKENKYEKLDNDQKKLFAIGLMLMDKGAVGMGSSGTGGLLCPESMKKEQADEIAKKVEEYVKGGRLNVNVDYKEALFKLVNYGDAGPVGLTDKYVLSETAYEKALQFAKTVSSNREAYGEKDVKRITDGYSSIYAAFVNEGKKQQNEVDKLQGITLGLEDIRDRLIQYAENDKISKKKIIAKTSVAVVGTAGYLVGNVLQDNAKAEAKEESDKTGKTVSVSRSATGTNTGIATGAAIPASLTAGTAEEDISTNIRLSIIQKRFKKMSDSDLKLFTRLMQERSVMDITTGTGKDDGKFADADTREALKDALCGDVNTRNEVLKGFDDNESCHQALATALSFQLKDHLNFTGKPLTKEYFDKESLNRSTLVDWNLIERTFELMDEIKAKRNKIYVLKNSSKYIKLSGNKKAIDAHNELEKGYKDKKDKFTQFKFETMLSTRLNNEAPQDIKDAYSGFQAFDEKDKKLFFKVLARRDLLDISKKGYVKSFLKKEDREFVNEADRNKLIDEYINASLEDNIGIQLGETAYYDAMESLFSTQVNDTTDFSNIDNIENMFAGERLFFMNRATAVDWKLFRRAVNFVKRARNELDKREGNDLLYRAAGDLSDHGNLVMDYKFLRRNFHKTGNRWNRYLGKKALQEIKEVSGVDKYLEVVANVAKTANTATDKLKFSKSGYAKKGIKLVNNFIGEAQNYSKMIDENPSPYNIEALDVKKKAKTDEEKKKEEEEEQKEKERRENLHFYEHMKEGIDNIIALKKSNVEAMNEVMGFIKDNFASRFVDQKYLNASQSKEAEADKENLVVKTTKDAKKDTTYGDSRDYLTKLKSYKDKVSKVHSAVKSIPGTNELLGLAQYGAEMLTFRLINKKIVNADVADDENELKNLKKEAEKYYKDIIDNVVISVVGKENAKVLLDGEVGLYNVKDGISKMTTSVTKYIKYAKKCVANIKGITDAIDNKQVLSIGKKSAEEKREEDKKKLKETGSKRVSQKQLKKAGEANEGNRAVVELGREMVDTLQNFNIAENAINLTIDTVNLIGGKLNVPEKIISKAIKTGLEFAMFAARVATDRKALIDYFFGTSTGQKEVKRLQKGFLKTGQQDTYDKFENIMQKYNMNIRENFTSSSIDIISNANGYEHTSELIEDTAMNIAQSIVFCASDFNPMAETKLMATTVMIVMGLEKEIGKTSSDTVEKLYKSFKMTT